MSESYQVIARRYRPKQFSELVGQEHIVRTLTNAIESGRIGHAYLFVGPRGTGKTTVARLFAKALNAKGGPNVHPEDDDISRAIMNGSCMDVVEIDGASNRSIDEIRKLREDCQYAPAQCTYKIYIIDEVHMLSLSAANAFLKTLEEPPAYAKFILATTEKQKIIPTILSRCQIFDFHRIKNEDIAKHLEYIAGKENVKYESEALHIIAQKADGGLRDALSMFDRLVSFTNADLSYKNVIDNLNILDYDYYFTLVDNLLAGNLTQCLLLFDDILAKGFEGNSFMAGLASHLRELLVCKNPQSIRLVQASEQTRQRYLQQAQNAPELFILRALEYANACGLEYRESYNKRLCVELALMRMAYIMRKLQPAPMAQPQEVKKKMIL